MQYGKYRLFSEVEIIYLSPYTITYLYFTNMGNIKKSYIELIALFVISFISQLFFAVSVSPLTPFEGLDVSMFKQLGEACLQGKELYLDIFDHKGPMIFFINALGLWLSNGRWGVFILVVLNCFAVLLIWHKTARFYITNRIFAFLPVLLALITYLAAMQEGDQTEEWCLIPASYSLYILARKLVKGKDPLIFDYMSIGLFSGLVLFLRANNLAVVVCSILYLTYLYIKDKEIDKILIGYACMIIGAVVSSLVILLYFYVEYGFDGVKLLMFGTFLFNFSYAGFSSYYDVLISSLYNHAFFLGSIVLISYVYINNKDRKDRKELTIFFGLSFIFCFYTMGTACFRHYMINVAPLFLLASCYAFKDYYRPYILYFVVALLVNESFFKNQLQFTIGQAKQSYENFYNEAGTILNRISEEDRNSVWNYNAEMLGCGVLQHFRIVQMNRVILNFHRNISPILAESEDGLLQKVHPKYLLLDKRRPFVLGGDSIFIYDNYEIVKDLNMHVATKNTSLDEALTIMKHK